MSRYSEGRTGAHSVFGWESGTSMTVEEINQKVNIIYSIVGKLNNDREVADKFYELCKKHNANNTIIKKFAFTAKCNKDEVKSLFEKYSKMSNGSDCILWFLQSKSWCR